MPMRRGGRDVEHTPFGYDVMKSACYRGPYTDVLYCLHNE